MGVEISKVVIKLGKREIELSIDDARALKEALDGMFVEATKIVTIPNPYPVPYVVPYRRWDWPYWTEITCGSGSQGTAGIGGSTSDGISWTAHCAEGVQTLCIAK